MKSEAEIREIIDDARAYVAAHAYSGALDLLGEECESLRGHETARQQAGELLDICYFQLWIERSLENAAAALELIFRLARDRLLSEGRVEPEILENYKRALLLTGTSPFPLHRYARHQNLIELFSLTEAVAGDVAECGCARGRSAMGLCLAIGRARPGWRGQGFHILDSFEGLSEPQHEDLDMAGIDAARAERILGMTRRGSMAFTLEQVQAAFRPIYPEVNFHAGWIPESLTDLPERSYRFVHVDLDLYRPTLGAFEYFFARLEAGGVIATDDYNWPGGKRAVDEFCAANDVQARFTNTHQAYLQRRA